MSAADPAEPVDERTRRWLERTLADAPPMTEEQRDVLIPLYRSLRLQAEQKHHAAHIQDE